MWGKGSRECSMGWEMLHAEVAARPLECRRAQIAGGAWGTRFQRFRLFRGMGEWANASNRKRSLGIAPHSYRSISMTLLQATGMKPLRKN